MVKLIQRSSKSKSLAGHKSSYTNSLSYEGNQKRLKEKLREEELERKLAIAKEEQEEKKRLTKRLNDINPRKFDNTLYETEIIIDDNPKINSLSCDYNKIDTDLFGKLSEKVEEISISREIKVDEIGNSIPEIVNDLSSSIFQASLKDPEINSALPKVYKMGEREKLADNAQSILEKAILDQLLVPKRNLDSLGKDSPAQKALEHIVKENVNNFLDTNTFEKIKSDIKELQDNREDYVKQKIGLQKVIKTFYSNTKISDYITRDMSISPVKTEQEELNNLIKSEKLEEKQERIISYEEHFHKLAGKEYESKERSRSDIKETIDLERNASSVSTADSLSTPPSPSKQLSTNEDLDKLRKALSKHMFSNSLSSVSTTDDIGELSSPSTPSKDKIIGISR